MITRTFLHAIAAGLFAGLLVTPVQYARVIPLILHAETYETGAGGAHDHPAAALFVTPAAAAQAATGTEAGILLAHSAAGEGAADHAPDEDGTGRLLGTVLANLVTGAGFALILCAVSLIAGMPVTTANGAAFGLLGFAVLSLAPALGLPPELPGMPAGDLAARQAWWIGTVLFTAAGAAALILRREPVVKALGVAALILPHLVAAPQPAELASDVPPTLAAEFAVASLATSAAFWLILGLASGVAFDRMRRGTAENRRAVRLA